MTMSCCNVLASVLVVQICRHLDASSLVTASVLCKGWHYILCSCPFLMPSASNHSSSKKNKDTKGKGTVVVRRMNKVISSAEDTLASSTAASSSSTTSLLSYPWTSCDDCGPCGPFHLWMNKWYSPPPPPPPSGSLSSLATTMTATNNEGYWVRSQAEYLGWFFRHSSTTTTRTPPRSHSSLSLPPWWEYNSVTPVDVVAAADLQHHRHQDARENLTCSWEVPVSERYRQVLFGECLPVPHCLLPSPSRSSRPPTPTWLCLWRKERMVKDKQAKSVDGVDVWVQSFVDTSSISVRRRPVVTRVATIHHYTAIARCQPFFQFGLQEDKEQSSSSFIAFIE